MRSLSPPRLVPTIVRAPAVLATTLLAATGAILVPQGMASAAQTVTVPPVTVPATASPPAAGTATTPATAGGGVAAPATPTTTATAPAAPTTTAPGAATSAAPATTAPATTAPPTVTAPVPQAGTGSATVTVARTPAKHGGGVSDAAIALAAAAAVVALCCAAWAVVRMLGLEPRWTLSVRHSIDEAGYRASATWAELTDWMRLGR